MNNLTFGDKVRNARIKKGWSQIELAGKANITQGSVSRIENNTQINLTQEIKNNLIFALDLEEPERLTVLSRINKSIPVISWISAGQFTECADHWPAGTSGEGEPVTSTKKLNDNVFGLRIVGDSMEPRYMVGDVIVIDPTLHCDNGCRCVVKLNGEVTFKVFNENDTEIRLSSLNEKYPDIIIRKDSKVEFKVIGKVVDMIPKL
jgi:SOS-response transcriptional repressor LexA